MYVGKRVVDTDRVQVRTVVEERAVTLRNSVERGVLDVERVTMDEEVNVPPPSREEGDMLIVSVVEERAEIVKRLFLIEELRIRRTSVTDAVAIPATVRTMRAVVDHGPELIEPDK